MKKMILAIIVLSIAFLSTAVLAGYPMISGIPNQKIEAGQPTGPIAFTVTDDITPASGLRLTARSNNTELVPHSNIDLGGSGSNRTVEVTPADGKWGLATIAVTVTDTDNETNQDTFEVEVVKKIRP